MSMHLFFFFKRLLRLILLQIYVCDQNYLFETHMIQNNLSYQTTSKEAIWYHFTKPTNNNTNFRTEINMIKKNCVLANVNFKPLCCCRNI